MELRELLDIIRQKQNSYSPSQKRVATYVLENYKKIPFESITTISEKIGVSHYSVINFCRSLGYNKFSEFKKALSKYASDLIIYNKLSEKKENTPPVHNRDHFFDLALSEDINTIQATLNNPTNRENLSELLNLLNSAQYIYITGGRSSSYFAGLFSSFLRYLNLKVIELIPDRGDYWDRITMIEPEDLVIAFSFPRYTAQVVNCLANLHQTGTPIVLITDTGLSPAQPYATLTFQCEVKSSSYIQCYAGCLSLISVICRAASNSRKQVATDHVRTLEKHLLEQGIFLP